jgi:hypothetical protein
MEVWVGTLIGIIGGTAFGIVIAYVLMHKRLIRYEIQNDDQQLLIRTYKADMQFLEKKLKVSENALRHSRDIVNEKQAKYDRDIKPAKKFMASITPIKGDIVQYKTDNTDTYKVLETEVTVRFKTDWFRGKHEKTGDISILSYSDIIIIERKITKKNTK